MVASHIFTSNYFKEACFQGLVCRLNSPNHTKIQNLVNKLVDKSIPQTSCVSYKYAALSILLNEVNGSVLQKEYEDMIVQFCTCREQLRFPNKLEQRLK